MRFYEDDKVTGLKIKDSFYEEWKDLINKVLFWTIIFAPYMIVLNDIYQNKLMHDNNFWIKRAKFYFAFIVITYYIMSFTLMAHIDYVIAFNLILTYLMLFGILKAQKKYMHSIKAKCEEYKPSKEEIEKIIRVQKIDENEESKKIKIKTGIAFFIITIVYYLMFFKLDNIVVKGLMILFSFFIPIFYDVYVQKN